MTREQAESLLKLELERRGGGNPSLIAVAAVSSLSGPAYFALSPIVVASIVAGWAYQRGYEDASARHLKAIEEEAAR